MLPLPEEVLADACSCLREVLMPALQEGFAREQAGLMLSLLEHVRLRLEHEVPLLIEDTRDVERVLREIGEPVQHDGSAAEDDSDWLSVARARNRDASARLQTALRAQEEAWAGDGPVPDQLAALRSVTVRQLDRQRSILGPGYALGT